MEHNQETRKVTALASIWVPMSRFEYSLTRRFNASSAKKGEEVIFLISDLHVELDNKENEKWLLAKWSIGLTWLTMQTKLIYT